MCAPQTTILCTLPTGATSGCLRAGQGCLLRYQITRKKLNSVTWQRDGLAMHGMQVKEESELCDGRKEQLLADIK